MVEWLFLAMPWGCLRFVIVVFPDHTHLLFFYKTCNLPILLSKKYTFFEIEMLMVSGKRATFLLLSESTYHLCNSYHHPFYNQEHPISQI